MFKVLFTLRFVSFSGFLTQKATGSDQVKRSVTLDEMTTSLSVNVGNILLNLTKLRATTKVPYVCR